jgi:hypothetical protein
MPYVQEIPIEVLLRRQWRMPDLIVDKICEGVPRPHHGSYLNAVWAMLSVRRTLSWQFDSQTVLRAGLWLRFHGPLLWDPDAFSTLSVSTTTVTKEEILTFKAVRLAFAVMRVGIKPHGVRLPHVSTVTNNLELFRLLCQGPWPRAEPLDRMYLAFQLTHCFEILVNDVRRSDYLHAVRDLRILESVFGEAFGVLELGEWCYGLCGDDASERIRARWSASRLRDLVLNNT